MLTLIALSAVLIQEPPAAPPPPPAPPEVRAGIMMLGPDGPGSLDKDGDGQVSRGEFAAPMNDHFTRMDKDGDGRLSTEELTTGHGPGGEHDVMILRRPGAPGEHGPAIRSFGLFHGPGAPHVIHLPGGERAGDGERRMEIVTIGGEGRSDLDKDGDGRISEAEFTAPLREAFGSMDADHSGFIEDGERSAEHGVHVFTHRVETRRESDQ